MIGKGAEFSLFEIDEQEITQTVTREKAEIAADFMTIFYHLQDRHTGNARVPDTAGPILARLLFGHD